MLSILTILVLLLLYTSTRFLYKIKNAKNKTQAPNPGGAWPIIGHLHLFSGQTPIFRTLATMADKLGPIFTIKLGIRTALVISSKETITQCFTTNDRVFLSRPKTAALKHMGYDGAFFGLAPYGPYWREMRKISTVELLSNSRLDLLKQVRESELQICINELYTHCNKNLNANNPAIVDVGMWFQQVTLNLMIRMIAGKRYSVIDVEDMESRRFGKAIKDFMYLSGVLELSDVIPWIGWMDLKGELRRMKKNADEWDYFMRYWLEEHLERRGNGNGNRDDEVRDFMDVMVELFAGIGFVHGHKSENVIKATVMNLILAGADTSSITLTWALSLLLNHEKVLKKAREELDLHIGKERVVQESDIKNLVYLQAIVKEVMRLYPPGPLLVPREAMEDCTIAGYHVPKGTRLLVNAWKLHRDPKTWPDPDEFQPERFLTSHSQIGVRGQQFEYLPFSSGRRLCPGITASLQMMHLMLARLLQSFDVALPMNAPVDMSEGLGLSLPKKVPLLVVLTPRLPGELYQQEM